MQHALIKLPRSTQYYLKQNLSRPTGIDDFLLPQSYGKRKKLCDLCASACPVECEAYSSGVVKKEFGLLISRIMIRV